MITAGAGSYSINPVESSILLLEIVRPHGLRRCGVAPLLLELTVLSPYPVSRFLSATLSRFVVMYRPYSVSYSWHVRRMGSGLHLFV